jgi:hypothetical protein
MLFFDKMSSAGSAVGMTEVGFSLRVGGAVIDLAILAALWPVLLFSLSCSHYKMHLMFAVGPYKIRFPSPPSPAISDPSFEPRFVALLSEPAKIRHSSDVKLFSDMFIKLL